MKWVRYNAGCLAVYVFLTLSGYTQAQDWTIEVHTGTSFKAPSSLTIEQEGHPTTRIENVEYETRPWVNFNSLAGLTENYYGVRVGFYPEDARANTWGVGYEAELLHDRAFYVRGDDPEGVVQHFELSDGLNYVFVNLAGRYPLLITPQYPNGQLHLVVRGGLGPAITAPASKIRGLESGTRTHQGTEAFYWLAGIGLQVGVQARLFLIPQLALSTEIKATLADTSNRIAEGSADTTILGLHLTFGFTVQIP